jgi:RNA polymerase-binding transcription factor DksA
MKTDSLALGQIKARLLARRAELQRRRHRVGQDLSRQLEPLSSDFSDRAIQMENDEPLQAIGQAAVNEIADIDIALDRISRGLYGSCRLCGERISIDRLAAVPQASTCQHCGNR